jgi:mRNA-degrading endonuclease YafQ of YafQ-DinJ toxin-antitoxin module
MIKLGYKSTFIRQFNKLENLLAEEVIEKIELFKNPKNHDLLKVHKLHGRLNGRHSFYVNYKIRIVFDYISKSEVVLLAVGDHDIFK